MEIFGIILIGAFYFLPTIIGWNKRNSGAILILNLFLGWTILGWIIALIWSFTSDTPIQKVVIIEKENRKEKRVENEKAYTRKELQRMLDNLPKD